MNRAGQLEDVRKCLSVAKRNLTKAVAENDSTPLGDSRVYRAEQAVKAWEKDEAELVALISKRRTP